MRDAAGHFDISRNSESLEINIVTSSRDREIVFRGGIPYLGPSLTPIIWQSHRERI
jgi:hypothetical protein